MAGGAWPHETRAEAELAQTGADAGDPAIQWQTHAEEVASDYAATILGWDTVAFDDSLDSPDSVQARVELYVATCEVTREDACREQSIREGRAQQEALLVLERLVREGEGGVWDVTEVFGPASFDHRVQPGWGRLPGGGQQQCPSTDPVVPADGEAEAAAQAVLTAANSRVPEIRTVWDWLEPEAQRQFGPYELFEHHLRSTPAEPYGEWIIDSAGRDFSLAQDLGSRCGEDVRAAAVAVYVTFPNDPNASEGTGATLIFIGHADGLKLWSV